MYAKIKNNNPKYFYLKRKKVVLFYYKHPCYNISDCRSHKDKACVDPGRYGLRLTNIHPLFVLAPMSLRVWHLALEDGVIHIVGF